MNHRENSTISLIILNMDGLKTPNKGKDQSDKKYQEPTITAYKKPTLKIKR